MDVTHGGVENRSTWPTFVGKSADWRRSGSLGRRPRHIKQNGRSAARAPRIVAGHADGARGNRQTSPAAWSRTALTAVERREEACEAISNDVDSRCPPCLYRCIAAPWRAQLGRPPELRQPATSRSSGATGTSSLCAVLWPELPLSLRPLGTEDVAEQETVYGRGERSCPAV
jgi:hypothetical protein